MHLITSVANHRFRRGAVKTLLIGGILCTALGIPAILAITGLGGSESGNADDLITKKAQQTNFRMVIEGRGYLQSVNNLTLSSEVQRETKIIKLLDEGTAVKKDDVICELDSSYPVEKAAETSVRIAEATSAMEEAKEQLGIQKTQNESDIAKAELEKLLAELDLKKYRDGEFFQEKTQIEGQIKLKEEELARSREALVFTKRMARKGYRSQTDLEADQIAVNKADLELQVEKVKLKVLDNYTYKRKIAELESNAKEKSLELERAKRKAAIALTKAEAEFESRKLGLELEEKQLKHWEKQIAACTIRAPQNGEVIYANEQARRYRMEEQIRVGAQVYASMPIVRLPDLSEMKVDAKIHESRFAYLKVGQTVDISVEAYPDDVFKGKVTSISAVPVDGQWPNYDIKQYDVAISVEPNPKSKVSLRPGLSCKFEILVRDRPDVLLIPVQSVVTVGSDSYVFITTKKGHERRLIKTGESNDTDIEILDGVKAGEEVVMNPRTAYADEIADLMKTIETDDEEQTQPAALQK